MCNLLGMTQTMPALQARVYALLLLLRGVCLPPRLTTRRTVDAALPVTHAQTTLQGALLTHAGGIKPSRQGPQALSALGRGQRCPPVPVAFA
ncbi:hypothetical protein DEAB109302_11050 [Dermacoccus abyssi]